ncbi:MAG: DnaJ domain-containing protein, partial [Spirochaetota bacterium]
GAPFTEVKKSYKQLMREYHPDRHAASPENLKKATEMSKRINYSFQRIKKYLETGKF